MNFPWKFFIDLGIISIALLLATFLRARIKFFQKYLLISVERNAYLMKGMPLFLLKLLEKIQLLNQ